MCIVIVGQCLKNSEGWSDRAANSKREQQPHSCRNTYLGTGALPKLQLAISSGMWVMKHNSLKPVRLEWQTLPTAELIQSQNILKSIEGGSEAERDV